MSAERSAGLKHGQRMLLLGMSYEEACNAAHDQSLAFICGIYDAYLTPEMRARLAASPADTEREP